MENYIEVTQQLVLKNENSKKKLNFLFLLVFALFFISFTSAVTLNQGTLINSSGGSRLLVATTFNLAQLTVESNRIEFYNLTNFSHLNATALSNLSFFGLTNALLWNYNNGTVYGSSTISNNDGNINITLSPSNSSYVLDNFNLTEGISRANSPLWISSSSESTTGPTSSKTYNLASNLSNSINVTVVVNADCPSGADTITFRSKSGKTYSVTDYSCVNYIFSSDVLTMNLTDYAPSNSSNVLTIFYGDVSEICSNTVAGFNSFSKGLSGVFTAIGALLVIFFMGLVVFFYRTGRIESVSPTFVFGSVVVFVMIFIGMIVTFMILNGFGIVC